MTLKKFIKYFDDMNRIRIYDFTVGDGFRGNLLFDGFVFDDGADKILKRLYKKHYVLDRNKDGMAVMVFPYVNEHGAKLAWIQINVKRKGR